MNELFLTWGIGNDTWSSTTFNWEEVRIFQGGNQVYGGGLHSITDDTIHKLKKKPNDEENDEDLIVVIIRAKDKSNATVAAEYIQAKMTAQFIGKDKYDIHIIDESTNMTAYLDTEKPSIKTSLIK